MLATLQAWAQILAPIIAAVAAVASWRSATGVAAHRGAGG